MLTKQRRRKAIGAVAIVALSGLGLYAAQRESAESQGNVGALTTDLAQWVTGRTSERDANSADYIVLAPGDPVFLRMPDGSLQQVGRVRNHFYKDRDPAYTKQATVILDRQALAVVQNGAVLEYYETPASLNWVAKTLLSPDRQQQISALIARDWETHREEIMKQLQPVVEKAVERSVAAFEAELPNSLRRHRDDFDRIADRYQSEIIRQKVVPLVREEILPIVEEEVRPVAMELGKHLWERVSLWSFTWRYLYDVSPLPERNAVKREFDRFMQEEVRPALESRSEAFVQVTEKILSRISRNEKVRSVVRESLRSAATDAELQQVVWSIMKESVLENATLRSSLQDFLDSAEVQEVLKSASISFEPTAREIGEAVFGNRDKGITESFARTMRTQILMKDRRWLVLVPSTGVSPAAPLEILPGVEPMEFPLEFPTVEQSPLTP